MMWNRAELKMRGNMAFKKNYVSAVVVALLMGIFGTVSGESSARRVSENSDIYSGTCRNRNGSNTDCPCGKSICR